MVVRLDQPILFSTSDFDVDMPPLPLKIQTFKKAVESLDNIKNF